MNIAVLQDFPESGDLVRTEEVIWQNLEQCADKSNWNESLPVLIKFPFAQTINQGGISAAQSAVDHACAFFKDKRVFFICQHILAGEIVFPPNSTVFTPHSVNGDNFLAIPHLSPFSTDSRVPIKERRWDFSFHGALYNSNSDNKERCGAARELIFKNFFGLENFNIKDTGGWHFEKPKSELEKFTVDYRILLTDSVVSLCPRGTGPSTIRIWDSLALGAIPLIISDNLRLPLESKVDWDRACFFCKESDIPSINSLKLSKDLCEEKSSYGFDIFNTYFNEPNLHKSILEFYA